MIKKVLLILVLSTSVVYAQTADPIFLQHAIATLQAQRNAAMDAQTIAEAKLAGLTDELTKANARIKELETKPVSEKK